jgi:hypothetical protein
VAEHDDDYTPITETPEWKTARALRASKGAPKGRHIRSRPDPDEPIEMSREELFEHLLTLKEENMVISGVRFDRSISLGAVAGILMTVISWGAAYGVFTRWQGDVDSRIAHNASDIADNKKNDEARLLRYGPQLEAMQRVLDVASDRQNNTATSMTQLRDIVTDLAKSVSQTHEEIMVLKARMGYDKRTELQEHPQR